LIQTQTSNGVDNELTKLVFSCREKSCAMPARMQQCDSVIFMLALNVLTACRCGAIWNVACELCYANIVMPAHTLSYGAAGRALSYIV